ADYTAIEQLVRDYPYFQTGWLLLTRKSFLQRDPGFEIKLNLAAAHVIDRVKLYGFLHPSSTVALPVLVRDDLNNEKKIPFISTVSDNNELHDLLRSIHDRKQQILGTHEGEKIAKENSSDLYSQLILEDLKSAGSEFSSTKIDSAGSATIDPGIDDSELKVIKELEHEMEEQVAKERNQEFLILNETAGDGEFAPLHEPLNEEEDEIAFVEEPDPEVESISLIEEEFILRDLDQDLKVYELGNISEAEINLQIEPEGSGSEEIAGDHELEGWKEMELLVIEQEEVNRRNELELINSRAGGGAEFSPMYIEEESDEPEAIELNPELESILQMESIPDSTTPEVTVMSEKHLKEETSELRFSEHVPSPGEFLPGKSHSFLDWLQFFKPEKQAGSTNKVEKKEEPKTDLLSEEIKLVEDIGPTGTVMLDELNTIDRIVSTIRHEPLEKTALIVSPAELARKSIEMNDEIVTETLASIYESQGLIDKAIRMYARLSLKFPEKSLFFAARIKELKSKK
ncbi:MAG: hypothetical protein WBB36_15860, partial [Chitinophagales bacterium]